MLHDVNGLEIGGKPFIKANEIEPAAVMFVKVFFSLPEKTYYKGREGFVLCMGIVEWKGDPNPSSTGDATSIIRPLPTPTLSDHRICR